MQILPSNRSALDHLYQAHAWLLTHTNFLGPRSGKRAGSPPARVAAGTIFTSHLGDLPNLEVNADGTATKTVVAARLTLADVANRSSWR